MNCLPTFPVSLSSPSFPSPSQSFSSFSSPSPSPSFSSPSPPLEWEEGPSMMEIDAVPSKEPAEEKTQSRHIVLKHTRSSPKGKMAKPPLRGGTHSRQVQGTLTFSTFSSISSSSLCRNPGLLMLSDPSYFSIPSISELNALPKEKLKRVQGLTIAKKGSGRVTFLDEVDLTCQEDLCQAVVFEKRGVRIGENHASLHSEAPLRGHVRVELHNCLPKGLQKGLQGQKTLLNWIEKLKRTPGAKFESFDPHSGVWVFTVYHIWKAVFFFSSSSFFSFLPFLLLLLLLFERWIK